jgi:hypothetical protein
MVVSQVQFEAKVPRRIVERDAIGAVFNLSLRENSFMAIVARDAICAHSLPTWKPQMVDAVRALSHTTSPSTRTTLKPSMSRLLDKLHR